MNHLNITIENWYALCKGSLQYGYVFQLKVSFKIGLLSDTKHTHPSILILEFPAPPPPRPPAKSTWTLIQQSTIPKAEYYPSL